MMAYLPYVESVDIEDAYTEDEPVMVTLQFSATMNPQVLFGLQTGEYPRGSWIPGIVWVPAPTLPGDRTIMRPWVSEPLLSGAPVTKFTFNIGDFYSAGTYRLQVQTANSPEWGGLSSQYDAASPFGDIPTHPHAVYREYTFTVLPAQE